MRLEEARNFIWIAAVSVAVYFSPWPPSVGQFLTASIAAAAEDSGEDAKADENEEVEEEAKPIGLPRASQGMGRVAGTTRVQDGAHRLSTWRRQHA